MARPRPRRRWLNTRKRFSWRYAPRSRERHVTVLHATKTGGPVLLGEGSWRTVNGVLLNWRWRGEYIEVLLLFRRRTP